MSWKSLEPQFPEAQLLWWVWKDRIGETLEGYWGLIHDYPVTSQDGKPEVAKILLVYDDQNKIWYRAFVSGGLKRFNLKEIPEGARVRIRATRQNDRIVFSVQYNEQDRIAKLDYPDEYLAVDI